MNSQIVGEFVAASFTWAVGVEIDAKGNEGSVGLCHLRFFQIRKRTKEQYNLKTYR